MGADPVAILSVASVIGAVVVFVFLVIKVRKLMYKDDDK